MSIDPSQFKELNVTDTCVIWNVLSSRLLYMAANAAGCSFCCTNFVHYECLHKPRKTYTSEDVELQNRLKEAIQDGKFRSYHLDLEDLQEVDILQKRKNLGKGELASIAFAKKTNQAFLTDDVKARKLAEEVMTRQFVQTTPHLVGWLFFVSFLGDGDLKSIVDEHQKHNRPLAQYFKEMYNKALDYRSKLNLY
ncbi:hypothetical protein [Trichocoleus sp. FACHB-262]|uniref:hypothetical protein n=1 Tax=Trichocoleus sp. FACHB-262 TaxID=2692869 RepID=UPI00168A2D34|nr:hypothetical protein [Trichocoleus sp. FACHB-262]MBD2119387.1 hypothetical protein [Trichocoleus sp. FACHB-262]